MTKKYFQALALTLNNNQPLANGPNNQKLLYDFWKNLVIQIAATCKHSNPNFNSYTFYQACGLNQQDWT